MIALVVTLAFVLLGAAFTVPALRHLARQFPDPALTRYRLRSVVKFAGFDERLYLRGQQRALAHAIAVLALRRRRIASRLRALDQPVAVITMVRPRRSA